MGMPDLVESNVQFASMWKVLVGDAAADAELSDRSGLAFRWAENLFPFWNAVFLTEQLSDPGVLADRLRIAASFIRTRKQKGLIYVCEEYLSGAAKADMHAVLAQEKLNFAMCLTGMAGDVPTVQPAPHPVLRFKRVVDDADLQVYADINSRGYEFPLEAGRDGLVGSRLWKESAMAYIGYDGDRPVSTAATIVNDGALYLALVSTEADQRRKGYGQATIRHALWEGYAATGLTRTILHATDIGFPVYRRVGYQKAAVFLTYSAEA